MLVFFIIPCLWTVQAAVISIDLFKGKLGSPQLNLKSLERNDRDSTTVYLKSSNNDFYMGFITVGTGAGPSGSGEGKGAQTFKVVFDTGSITTWIRGRENCPDAETRSCYIADEKRKTFYRFVLSYCGEEYLVGGNFYRDRICVDKYCVENGYIGVSDSSICKINVNFDGVFGMGYYKDLENNHLTLIQKLEQGNFSMLQQLFEENNLKETFGLQLDRNRGKLTIGGVDEKYMDANFAWLPVNSANLKYGWFIKIKHMVINNRKRRFPVTLVDSGSPYFVGPKILVQEIWKDIGIDIADEGLFDCSHIPLLPDITFEMTDDFKIVLSPDDYMISDPNEVINTPDETDIYRKLKFPGGICRSGFRHSDPMLHFIFGETFLRKVYTVFDAANRQVGFANYDNPRK